MLRLSLVLMLLFASPVQAAFDSGNKLHSDCSGSEGGPGQLYCMAFSVAIADVMRNGTPISGWKACFPKSATRGQVRDIVKRHLANNPQLRHYSAASLVAEALEKAFPC